MKMPGILFFSLSLLMVCCSKGHDTRSSLEGQWALTRQCSCNHCSDSIGPESVQMLDFSSDGQVKLTGFSNGSEQTYSGNYTVSGSQGAGILAIKLDAPDSLQHFLFVPGSEIVSVSPTSLELILSTPFFNPCQYRNSYTRVSR